MFSEGVIGYNIGLAEKTGFQPTSELFSADGC